MNQNTFLNVRGYKTQRAFQNRINHNNRKKNHSSYKYKNDDFLNIVEIVNANKYKMDSEKKQREINSKSKQNIYNKLTSYKSRLKKYKKEFEEIERSFSINPNDKKIQKMKFRKEKSIKKLENNIYDLERDYDSFGDLRKTNSAKISYNEIVLEITNVPKNLNRDKRYGKELLSMSKDFMKQLNLNWDIHSYSLHLDQSGKPHIHILGSFDNEHTMNKDLEKRYNKSFNLFELNKEFNDFVRNHRITKDYNFKVDEIKKGGKKEYLSIGRYKEVKKQAMEESRKFILGLRKKHKNNSSKYLELIEKRCFNLLIEKKMNQNISKKLEKELDKSKELSSTLVSELDDLKEKLESTKKSLEKATSQLLEFEDKTNNFVSFIKEEGLVNQLREWYDEKEKEVESVENNDMDIDNDIDIDFEL